MSEYLSDTEQKEQMLQWWKENGQFIVAGVGLALIGIFSWRYWVNHLDTQAGKASVVYTEMQDALNANANDVLDEKLAVLTRDYSGTVYLAQGHLLMARTAVEANDLPTAATHLETAIAVTEDRELAELAQFRLAKVRMALQEYAAGLDLLNKVKSRSYLPLVEELRGDIYRARGEIDKARAAYEAAQIAIQEIPGGDANLLQMKLSDLGVSTQAAN